MAERKVAIVIFKDTQGNIGFQKRGDHSKMGETYAFWGGGMEPGESPKQAIVRELREELDYQPNEIEHWTQNQFTVSEPGPYLGLVVTAEVFLSPLTLELRGIKALEGDGMVIMSIADAIKSKGFYWGDEMLLEKLAAYLQS